MNTPWPIATAPTSDTRDLMTQDQLLVAWDNLKAVLTKAKENEMEYRKYIVGRAFPDAQEGTNTIELGAGYELKAVKKFNYRLDTDNEKIEAALERISKVGNQGQFIADRLVSWTPNFLITEYRNLQAQADDDSKEAKEILRIINEILTITDGAPTLEIKAPKGKK